MKIIILACALLLSACGSTERVTETQSPAPLEGVWVDVRSPEEFSAGHIEGAINLPHNTISAENPLLAEGSLPKNQTLLVYCRSGRRSGIAKGLLEPMGYTVEDVGGFNAALEQAAR